MRSRFIPEHILDFFERRNYGRGVENTSAAAPPVRIDVAAQMRQLRADEFNELLRSAIKQDEWLLFVHGGVLGFFAGLLHLAIFGV